MLLRPQEPCVNSLCIVFLFRIQKMARKSLTKEGLFASVMDP